MTQFDFTKEYSCNKYLDDISTGDKPESNQIIYYGCPGSGKSHMVNRLVNSSFFKYLLSRQLSESSCNKYANVLKAQWIVDIAKKSAVNIESLYDTKDIKLINKVLENPDFIEKDEKGQRM